MIEMNLTDSPAYIVGNYSSGAAKKSVGVFILIIILVLVPLFSIFLVRVILDVNADKETQAVQKAEEVTAVISKKSRTAQERIVEEIIDSVGSLDKISIADKKYEDMTEFEQLDYEVKFSSVTMDEFVKKLPAGILFNTIKISNYKTLVAEGTAPDRATVSALLSRFKTGGWELLPQPKTKITDGGSFYYFRIEANFTLPVSILLKNPINPEYIPAVPHLNSVKNKIIAAAKNSRLKTSGLELLNSVNEPTKKKYTYRIKLDGGFMNVLDFLKIVSQIIEPVRVESIILKNRQQSVEATATIVISVR